jgi:hypothetical protein
MGCESGRVVYFGGEAGDAVDDDFWDQAYASGYYWGFAGHGFEDRAGAAFYARG